MSDETAGLAPEDGSPVHDAALDAMMAQWVALSPDTIDVDAALARVNARRAADASPTVVRDELAARRTRREVARPTPIWRQPAFRAAAAVVAVIGATLVWRSTQTSMAAASFVTTTGTSSDIRLTDGTEVRLGPASRLTLSAGFGRSHRQLTLHGEAWFKVTHNAAMPFAIRVGNATVEDVGTAFLVRESSSREVSVRVAEGVVKVTMTASAHDSTVTLHAGDGAVATATGISVAPGVVSANESVALAAGRLTFTDASLVEVQDALHRWYGVSLLIADSALATRHVTADFTGEPLSRVAAVLGLTLGVSAESHGDTIELHTAAGAPARP
ncbi:MAG: FecR domain-containing protein [Gemmatimonadaceae bacterium]|nr:FecR domain-containing protein [Gemmatimonadaceae bacterium]